MKPACTFTRAALGVIAILGAGACPAATTTREPDEYGGCGTDENWRTFDDEERAGKVKTDDTQATSFTLPAEGAMLAAAAPPTFTWQPSATIVGQPNGEAMCAQCPTCGTLSTMHLPAVSGDVYDVQLSTGGAVVYRLITTMQKWTPPAALWSSLAGKGVSVATVRMVLKVNDVQDGPYQSSAPLHFSVGN